MSPPIPPFELEPLRGRFVGLHAAAVAYPKGCVILAGDRGTGKTTLARLLVNELDGSLLTDETVCMLRRTRLVAPFPRAAGVWHSLDSQRSGEKQSAPASDVFNSVANQPIATRAVVVLSKDRPGPRLTPLSRGELLRLLLSHSVDVGGSADENVVTLARMSDEIPGYMYEHSNYGELIAGVSQILATVQ